MPTASEMTSQAIGVIEMNPRTDPRWESFVARHPNGSIYHHPLWLEALEREYGQKGVYLSCVNAAGQVLAILPMLYTRGLPFNLGGALAERRLSSLPRTPIAGPLSIDSRATVAVLEEAVRRVSQNPGIRLEIKAQGPELDGLVDGLVCKPWRLSYVLQFRDAPNGHYRVPDGQERAKIRWTVNKATRLGVSACPAETEAELSQWYRLYLDTMRRNLVPPRPYHFFATLWELLRPRGMMQLLLAEQHTKGQRKLVAGSIFLTFGRTSSFAFNGSNLNSLSLRPNDVILWHAINEAWRKGYRSVDLGEVLEGHEGLARFKRKWGAEPIRMHRYYYPALSDSVLGGDKSRGPSRFFMSTIWDRLPLRVTAWIGDRIYRFL